MIYERKYFSCCILLAEQILFFWLCLLLEILGNMSNMCIKKVWEPGYVTNFEINHIFSNQAFFLLDRKFKMKN